MAKDSIEKNPSGLRISTVPEGEERILEGREAEKRFCVKILKKKNAKWPVGKYKVIP